MRGLVRCPAEDKKADEEAAALSTPQSPAAPPPPSLDHLEANLEAAKAESRWEDCLTLQRQIDHLKAGGDPSVLAELATLAKLGGVWSARVRSALAPHAVAPAALGMPPFGIAEAPLVAAVVQWVPWGFWFCWMIALICGIVKSSVHVMDPH